MITSVALTVASFAFFNSGARTVSTCERHGSGGSGTLSWWRPGAVCGGGYPGVASAVHLNTTFLVEPAVLLLLAVFVWAVQAARDSSRVRAELPDRCSGMGEGQ